LTDFNHPLEAFSNGLKNQLLDLPTDPNLQRSTLKSEPETAMQRRAQSVRHHSRPSLAHGADDLGMLREIPDESVEDILRRQVLEKDRENDKVCLLSPSAATKPRLLESKRLTERIQLKTQIQALQEQLKQRPPYEVIEQLHTENKNLDILIEGMQRENERAMQEQERYAQFARIQYGAD
jgi:hypothetical protein